MALWSASNYIAAFMRASNAIYDVPEGRPVWKTLPIRIAVTVVVMALPAASAVAVVATGGLADRLGRLLGVGSAMVTAWDLVKWPVLLLLVGFLFALLYWASPNAKQGFRWVTPGGTLAVVVWVIASVAFAIYAECRAGTQPGHRRRPPTRRGALHGAARHPKDPGTRQPVADIHHPATNTVA